jgi:Flp pilus assembly protein TadD
LACTLLLGGCANSSIFGFLQPRPDEANAPHQVTSLDGAIAPRGSFSALMRIADTTRNAGDPSTSIHLYRRAHALRPERHEPLVGLGWAYAQVGAYNEAAEAYRSALARKDDIGEALRGLGNALVALNQPTLALDNFDAALRADPSDYRAYNGMGVAYDMIGDHRAAQAHYRVGLAEKPNHRALRNNLALSLALSDDFAESVEILERLTLEQKGNKRQKLNLAMVLGLAGRTEEAARAARQELPEIQVQSNLLYYRTLRAMSNERRTAAVFGFYTSNPTPNS